VEALLVPFHHEGRPIGTVWVVSHQHDKHFDAEDLRVLRGLTRFAAAAAQAGTLAGELRRDNAAKQQALDSIRTQAKELRQWFEQAPGFIAVLRGEDHTFELANRAYREITGSDDLVGKSALDSDPELRSQELKELLDGVYASGVSQVEAIFLIAENH
jgi:PAS domain-containing protein